MGSEMCIRDSPEPCIRPVSSHPRQNLESLSAMANGFLLKGIVMAVKHLKPTSAGRRWQTISDFSEITCTKPEKSLLEPLPKKAGRNNNGRITTRHIGGGHKRKYRLVDFKRNKFDVPATVKTLEYDPNRSAFIALVEYEDGAKSYILAPDGLKVGDKVMAGPTADIKPGNALPFENIPVGTMTVSYTHLTLPTTSRV